MEALTLATPMSEWPSALTAMPALKSRYRRPSVSQIYAPFPCDMTTGGRAYTGRTYCAERSMRALTVRGTLAGSSGWVTAVYLVDGALGSDAAGRGAFWIHDRHLQIHAVMQNSKLRTHLGQGRSMSDRTRTQPQCRPGAQLPRAACKTTNHARTPHSGFRGNVRSYERERRQSARHSAAI